MVSDAKDPNMMARDAENPFLFITEEIKLNTVIVEGGYIARIPAKNMYKSKFTGCKSIQPLRSVLAGSTFCSNDCCESFGVGLYQLCTVRW